MQLAALLSNVIPGTVYPVSVGGDVAQVGIDNDSPYDCWVSFGPQPPLAAPGPTTQALYNGVARSMATSYFPVPDLTPPFNGVLYLGIYAPLGLAQSGVSSSRANVYVTALAQGEQPGAVFAVPRLSDVTSQPRVIALPIGIQQFAQGRWNVGTSNPLQVQLLQLGSASKAAQSAAVYLFYCSLSAAALGGTGNADMTAVVQLQPQDVNHVALGTPFVFARGDIWVNNSNETSTPWYFAPSVPACFAFKGTLPTNSSEIAVQLLSVAGTPIVCDFNILCDVDRSNTIPIADIGNWPSYQSAPSVTGATF